MVHGSQDAVSTRYTPLLNGLNDNNACTETRLMSGVGHTIDFPNRNQILSEAFQWIKNNNCGTSSIQDINLTSQLLASPNPSQGKFNISNANEIVLSTIQITDLAGKKLRYDIEGSSINLSQDTKGMIILTAKSKSGNRVSSKILIE